MILILAIDLIDNKTITIITMMLGTIILVITIVSVSCKFALTLKGACGRFIVDYDSDKILFIAYLGISSITMIYSYFGIWSTL